MRTTVLVALMLAVAAPFQRGDLGAQTDTSKLTTVLADLVRASSVQGDRAGGSARSMPKSAADALQGRRLRISAADEVQVYVLMEVTDEHVRQLTAAGAIVEIRDARQNRVQARIPVAALPAVAALPFVNFVRLPSYAVRRTGAVTTEGDAILRADVVRRQLSLDGSGVKVGVVSDGIKGIFATGCTSCAGVGGGPIATGDLPSASGTRNSSG